jgi:hypothetical protein
MQLHGARAISPAVGLGRLPGKVNYFIGSDKSRWIAGVPTFSKVRFSEVYPGIDLVYYGNQSQLEYDFVVAPQADAKCIRLHFTGVRRLAVKASGDLWIQATGGQIAFRKPDIYQEANGLRRAVPGRFMLLSSHSVGFSIGDYDHSQPLIIDPVLAYSTYLDESLGVDANAIAVDLSGNAYVAGTTVTSDYPVTQGAFQTANQALSNGSGNAFITKLSPAGTEVVYSTYLGGSAQSFGYYTISSGDSANGIAVDAEGNAYVAGQTTSNDFPVTAGAFQTQAKNPYSSAFITKLNPTGSALVYSTYLGGSGGDQGGDGASCIALDSSGNAYVGGVADSPNFPVSSNAFQKNKAALISAGDGFVAKLNASGTGLVYSTYLGGSGGDQVGSIAVDGFGNAYVTGTTTSSNFPVTLGAFQTQNKNLAGLESAFVTKLNDTASALIYSTYLGGSGRREGHQTSGEGGSAIAVDGLGNAFVAGNASSSDFPVTPGALQSTTSSIYSGFITKLNPTGTALVYSTYLGGSSSSISGLSSSSIVSGLALDSSGNAYIAGYTYANNFPVTPLAFQTSNDGTKGNGFVSKLNATGSSLLYSTYLGGSGYNENAITSIALDGEGGAYIAGVTGSADFPVTAGAFQTVLPVSTASSLTTGFAAKLNLGSPGTTIPTTTTLTNDITLLPPGRWLSTFYAKVAGAGSNAVPTGNVVFVINFAYAGTVPLDGEGIATISTHDLQPGQSFITAGYVGDANFGPSAIAGSVTIQPAEQPPGMFPPPGKYLGSVTVALSDVTPDTMIYYTLNGGPPTTASQLYTGPFTISSGYVVVQAVAVLSGYMPGPESEGAYSILAQTPAPTIRPLPGSYSVGQPITIADSDQTATIRYTLDGSTPTTTSNWYHEPILLTGSETIQSVAISTGRGTSNTTSASYTVP